MAALEPGLCRTALPVGRDSAELNWRRRNSEVKDLVVEVESGSEIYAALFSVQ